MSDRLGGVLMIAGAFGLGWAFFTGRLDGAIAEIVARATGKSTADTGPLGAAARKHLEKLHGPGGARDPFRGELQ